LFGSKTFALGSGRLLAGPARKETAGTGHPLPARHNITTGAVAPEPPFVEIGLNRRDFAEICR
jgi:hypothetical protein